MARFWEAQGAQAPPKNREKSTKMLKKWILGRVWDAFLFEGGFWEGLGEVLGGFGEDFGMVLGGILEEIWEALGPRPLPKFIKNRPRRSKNRF